MPPPILEHTILGVEQHKADETLAVMTRAGWRFVHMSAGLIVAGPGRQVPGLFLAFARRSQGAGLRGTPAGGAPLGS